MGAFLKRYAFPVIACVFVLCALGFLFRPVWFDEALTFGLLMKRTTPGAIYFSYEIPNNHIVYSEILSLWIKAVELFTDTYPVWVLRLPSLAAGFGALALLCRVIKRRSSDCAAFAVCVLLAGAFPFTLYATALRGYIFAVLLTVIAFILLERALAKPFTWRGYMLFGATALLLVGTAPTNLAALVGAILFFAGDFIAERRLRELMIFCLTAIVSVPVFYAGILSELAACSRLGEGWTSGADAAFNLYTAFAVSFAPLAAFIRIDLHAPRNHAFVLRAICRTGVLLMPVAVWLVFPVPPFPRVFLPFFVFWAAMLAEASKKTGTAGMTLALIWVAMLYNTGHSATGRLYGTDGRTDDLVSPYYVREGFRPGECADGIMRYLETNPQATVFVTFEADYPAVMFYLAALCGKDMPENIIFDRGGEYAVKSLPRAGGLLVVCAGERDLSLVIKRFGLPRPSVTRPVSGNAVQIFAEF